MPTYMFKGKSLHMPTVILIAASCAQPPCIEHLTRGGQTGRPYLYYDDATRREESAVERARREWQERWPAMEHCRLPACSTR
jgi:hypothetical protein